MNTYRHSARILHSLMVICAATATASAVATPSYTIATLGLDDLEHTRNDGYKYSLAEYLDESGRAAGYSNRFDGGSVDLGRSAWLYDGATTRNIGLVGPEFTRSDGYQYSASIEFFALNEAGQVVGYSKRYDGSVELGRSAWLYDGTATRVIGLTGPEYTRADGYQTSASISLNQIGQVIGSSARFDEGNPFLGYSAWFYNGTATVEVGLTGPEHTRADGYRHSSAQLDDVGNVSGSSMRYGGSADLGQSLWTYDGTNTVEIGPTGPEYTRSDGYKYSSRPLYSSNTAGQIIGNSTRYDGDLEFGISAWLYSGATTLDIGLTGPEHTRSDGYKYGYAEQINDAGQVIGIAGRYNGGSTRLGSSAWFYNGMTTTDIGLTGPEFTSSDGFRSSKLEELNDAGYVIGSSTKFDETATPRPWIYNGITTVEIGLSGPGHTGPRGIVFNDFHYNYPMNSEGQVIGTSARYDGEGHSTGTSAWLYDGTATIEIGLTGPEHTDELRGYRLSSLSKLNEAGQVIGGSARYNGGNDFLGVSAWLFNGATTIEIGLVGSEYTRSDGYRRSSTYLLNDAGQAGGKSDRYSGGSTQLGQDAWFYDPVLEQTIALNLSTRSDGYAFSEIEYFGEDGLVLGTYTLYDALDSDLGDRAFAFTVADGLHDLGALVDGGLSANGWDWLASAFRGNGLGQILGHGTLSSQSGGQMPYLLTPLPEPSTFPLIALLAPAFLASAQRRHT